MVILREQDREEIPFVRSVVFREDGSATASGGYRYAVYRLYEYESSGVLPEDAQAGHRREHWERYTAKAQDGSIYAQRGWECVLGRLFRYECSGLSPEQWRKKMTKGM